MASSEKLKISQHRSSISRFGTLHETLGETGQRTHTIVLEKPNIHFDNIYQGALNIEKHPSALKITLNVVQTVLGSDAKHTSYIASVEELFVPSELASVELRWFGYDDGFVPSNNSLVGKIQLGLIELNMTLYPATADETPDAWICFVSIESAISLGSGLITRI